MMVLMNVAFGANNRGIDPTSFLKGLCNDAVN